MSKVKVYYFKRGEIVPGETCDSKSMATLEWIEKQNFTPILETGKEIDDSALDPNGLYREEKKP